MKLHLGCGNIVLEGWINQDLVKLKGVDSVCDLQLFPWPYEENSFDELQAHHVLEHLPDTVKTIEEMHRICRDGAVVNIRVPFWNSPDMISDPTHRVFFNERSFDYFDPEKDYCIQRPYYSSARFIIEDITIYIKLRGAYKRISSRRLKKILFFISKFFCGVIWVIEFELKVIK